MRELAQYEKQGWITERQDESVKCICRHDYYRKASGEVVQTVSPEAGTVVEATDGKQYEIQRNQSVRRVK